MEEEEDYSEKPYCWSVVFYGYGYMLSRCSKCGLHTPETPVWARHWSYRCSSKSCRVIQPHPYTSSFERYTYKYCIKCFEEYFDTEFPDGIWKEIERRQLSPIGLSIYRTDEYAINPLKVTRKLPTCRNSKRARE